MHLSHAERRIGTRSAWLRSLSAFIAMTTEAVIWLSTWGDSTRMAREFAATQVAA
jgi:ubiquinone biosynthesis monooxygenase Coq7